MIDLKGTWGLKYHMVCFPREGKGTQPKSHSQQMMEPRLDPDHSEPEPVRFDFMMNGFSLMYNLTYISFLILYLQF